MGHVLLFPDRWSRWWGRLIERLRFGKTGRRGHRRLAPTGVKGRIRKLEVAR